MQAIRFRRRGGPEVLDYEDADPGIERGGVGVCIRACAVNRIGIWVVIGQVGLSTWPGTWFLFAGRFDRVIDRTFPLADAAAAPRHLEEGKPFGHRVLEV